MNINININDFDKQFSKEYQFLYDNGDKVAGYDEAVKAFDESCKSDNFKAFVREYVKHRQDYISSDREAAAFMFALEVLA